MPPERHSGPGARPPRDRHSGPGFPGPRRTFGGGPGFPGAGGPRDYGPGPRPPFTPRPAAPPPPPAEAPQWVRLREGDREVEVHGSPAFVRQTIDDLPTLFARLRGEAAPAAKPQSISMPRPPRSEAAANAEAWSTQTAPPGPSASDEHDPDDDEPPAKPRRDRHAKAAANGRGSLEDRVFRTLERADHPLSVAAIRKLIGGDTSGQQIRRILERAADRVVATSERPAAYALR